MNEPSEPADAFADWVRARTRSVEDDYALLDAVAGAKVIAVGEPGHGAHEPLAFRNKLVRSLLQAGVLGAVALESGVLEARVLNHYVHHGGAKLEALARDHLTWGFGTLADNVELLRLLTDHNAARADKVEFFGFDIPGGDKESDVTLGALAPRTVAAYLRSQRTGRAQELAAELEKFATRLQRPSVRQMEGADRDDVRRLLDVVEADLAERTAGAPRYGLADDGAWACLAARMVRAVFEMLCCWPDVPAGPVPLPDAAIPAMLDASSWRDRAMADNIEWLLQRIRGRCVLMFAANGHVIGSPHRGGLWIRYPDRGLPAGLHLRASLGSSYRVVLTCSSSTLPDAAIGAAPGSVDSLLSASAAGSTWIDLRGAPDFPWLDTVQSIGTNGPYPQAFVPRHACDVLVHFPGLAPAPRTVP